MTKQTCPPLSGSDVADIKILKVLFLVIAYALIELWGIDLCCLEVRSSCSTILSIDLSRCAFDSSKQSIAAILKIRDIFLPVQEIEVFIVNILY